LEWKLSLLLMLAADPGFHVLLLVLQVLLLLLSKHSTMVLLVLPVLLLPRQMLHCLPLRSIMIRLLKDS
jgi:hypothetical protein